MIPAIRPTFEPPLMLGGCGDTVSVGAVLPSGSVAGCTLSVLGGGRGVVVGAMIGVQIVVSNGEIVSV